jgi:carboxyl-terminal processing protease
MERYTNGEMLSKDSILVDDSLQYKTKGGKIVYGGGGIIPDIFVGRDPSQDVQDIKFMYDGGVMDRFIFNLLDENREFYNTLSQEDFSSTTIIDDKVLDDFTTYLGDYDMNYTFGDTRPILKKYLRATMAKQLFGTDLAEQIANKNDAFIEKLLSLHTKSNQKS